MSAGRCHPKSRRGWRTLPAVGSGIRLWLRSELCNFLVSLLQNQETGQQIKSIARLFANFSCSRQLMASCGQSEI